jgi:flavin reductase (DIM6/NTAB) family NADH-FMN oxidoreductase RutF
MDPDQTALVAPVDTHSFRSALGLFATGITVVTANDELSGHAMTANSFTSVSLEPPLVLVCVHRNGWLRQLVHRGGLFAISVLAADQQTAARHFAAPDRPAGLARCAGADWFPGPVTGAPLLAGCLAWLECALDDAVAAGDHEILLGRVLSFAGSRRRDPLLFFASDYHRLPAPGPSATSEEAPR